MPKTPKLSIIILNYNTKDLLLQTIGSIKSKLNLEIILVDNNSSDGSVKAVQKLFPQVQIIQNSKNSGFAAGNNLGLKMAKGEYLMLLNSDTFVLPNALENLVFYLDKHPKVGIVSPKLELANGEIDPACHRGLPTIWNSITYFSGLESKFSKIKFFGGYHQTWKDLNSTHQVEVVSGAAMVFPRAVLERVGFLDEDFFMYGEDIDYCKRVLDQGYQIVYHPKSTVIHYKGQSGTKHKNKQLRSQTKKYFYNTMKQYFRKHNQYPEFVLKLVDLGIDLVSFIKK